MNKITVVNAFSINMLQNPATLSFVRANDPCALLRTADVVQNAIGHPDTDRVVRNSLEFHLPVGERANVTFGEGDMLLVAQYKGPRLPEGATELPANATIEWWSVLYK